MKIKPFLWIWDEARLLWDFSWPEAFVFCILEQRNNNLLSLLKMDHSAPEQRLSLVGRTSSPFSALKYYSTPLKNTAKGPFGYCSQISPQVPRQAPFLPAPGWPFAREAATLNCRCWDPTASGHTLKADGKSSRLLPCDYEKGLPKSAFQMKL